MSMPIIPGSSSRINRDTAPRRIAAFRKKFGEAHLHLAMHAALPLALKPDLLYRIWANFQRDIKSELLNIPWVAVADILLSGLCDEVGYELYEMKSAVRAQLLNDLRCDPRFGGLRLNELSDFLSEYVLKQIDSEDTDTRDFAQAQHWTALAYSRPAEGTREIALGLVQVHPQDRAELARLSTLLETFAEPLSADIGPLLTYTRGLEKAAHGDIAGATAYFSMMSTKEVAGVRLPIPALEESQVRPTNWVLVAGLGTYELPIKVLETSERLGEMLAKEGYGLIVGGWQGVDHVVAHKFVEVLTQFGRSDQEFLVQVVGPRGRDYPKGQEIRKQTYEEELTEGLTRADVVILISGKGGVLHVGDTARQKDKPVFPLADTDGDARKAYHSILAAWDQIPMRGISKEEFTTLNTPAPQVVDHLIGLIKKSIGSTQMVQIGEVHFPKDKAREFHDGQHTGRREISVPVTFDRPFTRQPKVVVGLHKIDLGDVRANIHRISVRAENVRLQGFDLYFETWEDSLIYDAGVSWIAVSE